MKITKEGYAVVEGDMLLSRYVEEQGRLDVDFPTTDLMRPYIPVGGIVADVGACIGDHTVVYSEYVGRGGRVYAFEPNPIAFECLLHNTKGYPNVVACKWGLGAINGKAAMEIDTYNIGASRLVPGEGVVILRLDDIAKDWTRLDFIKIDAEGYEPWLLDGGMETLARLRPTILIEINDDVLGLNGFTRIDIYNRLMRIGGYDFTVSPRHSYDLLCIPEPV